MLVQPLELARHDHDVAWPLVLYCSTRACLSLPRGGLGRTPKIDPVPNEMLVMGSPGEYSGLPSVCKLMRWLLPGCTDSSTR